MNPFLINPYIRVAKQSILPTASTILRRIIYDYEILFVESGEFVLNYDNIDYTCLPGDFILIRPAISHSFTIVKNLSQPHIHFDLSYAHDSEKIGVSFKDIDRFSKEEKKGIRPDIFAPAPLVPKITFKNNAEARSLFYSIVNHDETNSLDQKGLMLRFLGLVFADNFPSVLNKVETASIAWQIKTFIDETKAWSFSLEDFANYFSYDKFYIERSFKKEFSQSIISYRNEVRMQEAVNLLKTQSVSQTAYDLGFNSIFSFSRAFKNYYGFSPTLYKR